MSKLATVLSISESKELYIEKLMSDLDKIQIPYPHTHLVDMRDVGSHVIYQLMMKIYSVFYAKLKVKIELDQDAQFKTALENMRPSIYVDSDKSEYRLVKLSTREIINIDTVLDKFLAATLEEAYLELKTKLGEST